MEVMIALSDDRGVWGTHISETYGADIVVFLQLSAGGGGQG